MYAKVDQLAKRERESLIDRLLDLDPAALPEEKQGKKKTWTGSCRFNVEILSGKCFFSPCCLQYLSLAKTGNH